LKLNVSSIWADSTLQIYLASKIRSQNKFISKMWFILTPEYVGLWVLLGVGVQDSRTVWERLKCCHWISDYEARHLWKAMSGCIGHCGCFLNIHFLPLVCYLTLIWVSTHFQLYPCVCGNLTTSPFLGKKHMQQHNSITWSSFGFRGDMWAEELGQRYCT
jgi:hypothetical protein